MFGYLEQTGTARLVVQEDLLDDSTACTKCKMAETLAYRCHTCERVFCNMCIGFGKHGCRGAARDAVRSGVPEYFTCEAKGCSGKNYVKMGCASCGENYCSRHRVEEDHACTAAVKVAKKARMKPKAAPVRRHKILTVPDLHVDDRFALTVYVPPPFLAQGQTNPLQAVVHKKWGTGRAIDFLTKNLDVPAGTSLVLLNISTLGTLPRISSFQELSRKGALAQSAVVALVDPKWVEQGVKAALPEFADTKADKAWADVRQRVAVDVRC